MVDLNQHFLDECDRAGPPTNLIFFSTTLAIIFLTLNIPGNFLVILAVVINPHKNLRTPFNYLLVNLAGADLIMGIVTFPLVIYYFTKGGSTPSVTPAVHHTIFLTGFISFTASILTLAALAVERYLALCNPHNYRNKLAGKRIIGTIGCIWLMAFSLPLLNLKVDPRTYAFIFINTTVVVSIGITAFTYAMMLGKSKRHSRNHQDTTTTTTSRDIHVQSSSPASSSILRDSAVQLEHKITKMFLVVMIVLLCSFGSAAILFYVVNLCKSCSCTTLHWLGDIAFILLAVNSNVNFFCYALRSPRFRKAFSHMLRITRNDDGNASFNSTDATGTRSHEAPA